VAARRRQPRVAAAHPHHFVPRNRKDDEQTVTQGAQEARNRHSPHA
jgi:hypothetical protein